MPLAVCFTKTLLVLLAAGARVRVIFYHDLPKNCGFILASNHVSHFDPPLITLSFPRRIDWIGMSELFRGRILRRLFSDLNVIPIERHGPDRAAFRIAAGKTQGRTGRRNFPGGRDTRRGCLHRQRRPDETGSQPSFRSFRRTGCPLRDSWERPPLQLSQLASLAACKRLDRLRQTPILPLENLTGEQRKDYVRELFGSEIVKLKERLCEDFALDGSRSAASSPSAHERVITLGA